MGLSHWLFTPGVGFKTAYLLLILGVSQISVAQQVEVFTASGVPHPTYPGLSPVWYELDAAERLEDQIPTFSADPEKAEEEAMVWVNRHGHDYAEMAKKAHEPKLKAMEYQLLKVPAIVIEGKYVVYGSVDVPLALRLYHQKVKQ